MPLHLIPPTDPSSEGHWLWILGAVWIAETALDTILGRLNLSTLQETPPAECAESYPQDQFIRSTRYFRDTQKFGLAQNWIHLTVSLAFLLLGGFGWAEHFAQSLSLNPILQALAFAGTLSLLKSALSLPFSLYSTFVIEAHYGFNKTTLQTFVLDLIKGTIIGGILGALVFWGVAEFFVSLGSSAWIWAWIAFTLFTLALTFLAPAFLLPLFNRFEPLPEGELKNAIARYAAEQNFDLAGVSVMDGSKRSAKSNAFFTGFGKLRKLALFDTLIAQQSTEEILAVVAHEVGHFKCGHIPRMIGLQWATTGILFWIMGSGMNDPRLFEAFGLERISVPIGLILVAVIYSPIMRFLSMIPHAFSRKHEFEADAYSISTYRNPGALISALKKLSRENFAHLTPHPLKVFFDYTHPPTLERIHAIERLQGTPS